VAVEWRGLRCRIESGPGWKSGAGVEASPARRLCSLLCWARGEAGKVATWSRRSEGW